MPEHVRGLAQARRAFKALPDVVRESLADVANETAEQIRAGAVRRVPVRYGFLRDHIATRKASKSGFAAVGVSGGFVTTPDGKTVNPSMYARFQEFGTVQNPPHPFMIPSAEEQRLPHLQRVRNAGAKIERDASTIGGSFL